MNITPYGSAGWPSASTSGAGHFRQRMASATGGGSDSVDISQAGFAAMLRQGPPPLSDEMAGKIGMAMSTDDPELFAQLDSDADGALTAAELEAARPPSMAGGPPAMNDDLAGIIGSRMQKDDPELFAQLDSDTDGTLTAAEMEAGLQRIGQGTGLGAADDYRANLMNDILRQLFASEES